MRGVMGDLEAVGHDFTEHHPNHAPRSEPHADGQELVERVRAEEGGDCHQGLRDGEGGKKYVVGWGM